MFLRKNEEKHMKYGLKTPRLLRFLLEL